MKTWVVIIVAVIIVALIAFFVIRPQQPMLSFTAGTEVAVSTSTITASTTEYTVDASYPQFGIPAIDSQIKSWIVEGENDLITQAQQDKPIENNFPQYSFTCLFNDPYIGSDYVSVSIVCGTYTGGAHEMPTIIGATFDRSTGQPMTLDQTLALTGMTLDQVASSSKAQLAENPDTTPTGIWASGSNATSTNYQTFLINKDSVTFIFQPYQVAPYASGAPEVSIPRVK